MKTVETVRCETTGLWFAKVDGEWVRTPKRGVRQHWKTEAQARRAAEKA